MASTGDKILPKPLWRLCQQGTATKLVLLKQFPSFLFPKEALKNTKKAGLPVRKKPDHTLGHIMPTFEAGFSSPLVYPVCNSTALHRAQPGSAGTRALSFLIPLPREPMEQLPGPGDSLLQVRHCTSHRFSCLSVN